MTTRLTLTLLGATRVKADRKYGGEIDSRSPITLSAACIANSLPLEVSLEMLFAKKTD